MYTLYGCRGVVKYLSKLDIKMLRDDRNDKDDRDGKGKQMLNILQSTKYYKVLNITKY